MRTLLLFCLLSLFAVATVSAEEKAPVEMIKNDCHVAGALAVEMMKHASKETPERLRKRAEEFLTGKGYKGSLGEPSFLAYMYVQSVQELPPQLLERVPGASPEDLELIALNHEIECVKNASGE